MKFLSVCSGIEAASVAWQPLGWKAVAFSEIEPFPCALLKHHYPNTPNWGDMNNFKDWPDVSIDLLCGGTPCQSFSVAGLRKGLDDPRGNLMLTFGAIAAKYRPKWLVWENVPGVLSSNGGRDFGAFLGMLGQLGYGFAYRVLDAQYFGVAQRRRRVFVVGCLGDWHSAAAVLFERHSLQGHPAPSRQTRQGIAAVAAQGVAIRGREGGGTAELTGPIATALRASQGGGDKPHVLSVAHCLRGEGFDASEDGTGRGTPLVPVGITIHGTDGTVNVASYSDVAQCLRARTPGNIDNSSTTVVMQEVAHALRAEGFDASEDGTGRGTPLVPVAYAIHENQRAEVTLNDTIGTLNSGGGKPGQGYQAVAYSTKLHNTTNNQTGKIYEEYTTALDRSSPPPALLTAMQVRRLTPEECEALQGFKRGYTAIPHRGKPAADGLRYKALGNSWATPNVQWIGRRIEAVQKLKTIRQMEIAA